MVSGQGMPVQLICHAKPYNNQIDGTSRYFGGMTPTTGSLNNFGLLFPVACFVFVSDQAL